MRFLTVFLTLILTVASPAVLYAQQTGVFQTPARATLPGAWGIYENGRFGTSIEYPSEFFLPNPPPENGDGLSFTGTDHESRFLIYAGYNVLEQAQGDLMAEDMASDRYDEITYKAWDKGWYVLSGYTGNSIFYRKVILRRPDETIHVFEITYPKDMKLLFDDSVSRMSDSFRTGAARY